MLCQYCEIKEIEMKHRPFCKECYRFLHTEGKLNEYPLMDRTEVFKKSLINKYGENIITEFDELINSEEKGLSAIAVKYGFTRERARQLFEIIYGFHYTVIKKRRIENRIEKNIINRQLKKDPRNKVERYKGGVVLKGAIGEKKVFEICAKLGYEIKPYTKDSSVDLVINDYLVEVKSAFKTTLTGSGDITPKYHFQLLDSQRKVDFIICYAQPENKFFIIPNQAYVSCNHLYIPNKQYMKWVACHGYEHNRESKWYKYLEAWDLLKRQENKEIIFNEQITTSNEVAI